MYWKTANRAKITVQDAQDTTKKISVGYAGIFSDVPGKPYQDPARYVTDLNKLLAIVGKSAVAVNPTYEIKEGAIS